MICGDCGTRNLPGASFCVRCGGVLKAAPLPEDGEPAAPLSPVEEKVLLGRDLLAAGKVAEALETAREAKALAEFSPLPHVLFGAVRQQQGELEEALREFRLAVELDPSQKVAREKAEEVRRQIATPHLHQPPPARSLREHLARIPRKAIPIIAGVAVGLLVFAVGAAAIVSRTSPGERVRSAFDEQMALGQSRYEAGRYGEAAEAFGRAEELDPTDVEAQRRRADAEEMAGLAATPPAPGGAPPIGEPRVAAADVSATPGRSAFPPVYIGPQGPTPGGPAPSPGRATVPPPIPAPNPQGGSARPGPDLPPLTPPMAPPGATESIEGASRVASTDPGGGEPPPEEHTAQPAQPKPPQGQIRIEIGPRRPMVAQAPTPPRAQVSAGDAARTEAFRLRQAGRSAQAGRKYGEAAALYRAEAGQGGADAAAKAAAAKSCEQARAVCESEAH